MKKHYLITYLMRHDEYEYAQQVSVGEMEFILSQSQSLPREVRCAERLTHDQRVEIVLRLMFLQTSPASFYEEYVQTGICEYQSQGYVQLPGGRVVTEIDYGLDYRRMVGQATASEGAS